VGLFNSLFLYASQARIFWRARALSNRLEFMGHRRLFGIRRHVRENRIQAGTFLSLSWLTLGQLILAILVAIAMQAIDPYLDEVYKRTRLTITLDIYGTLLGTVTGTGAVLVGLYYAATTAIGGAIYARVPNNIRDLLARERVGNVYIRHLAFLTYLGVILLAFRAAGLPPIKIAIPFFIVTSGIAIMAFVILGARAFNLFDPTTLSYDLFEQLRRDYLQMTPGAYRWLDVSFQRHAYRTSRSVLDTFQTLAEITATEPHLSGQPYLTLCQQSLLFAIGYERDKKRIPTTSLWYAQRYTHPDWYQTADSETSLAHSGAVALTPRAVSDNRWIENDILPIAYNCIRKNFTQGRYDIVTDLLSYIDAYVRCLAKEHGVQLAFKVLDDLTSRCGDLFFAPAQANEQQELLERVAVADALAAIPINILLEYLETIKDFSRASLLTILNTIKWKSRKSIYETGLPLHTLPRLEWLRPRIEFEIYSEGQQTSAHWYIGELVIQPVTENIKSATTALIVDVQAIYDKWLNAAASNKLLWTGATILSRETEYWSKVDYQLWRLRDRWTDLNAEKRIKNLPWPKLDFDQLDESRSQRMKRLLQLMSAHSTALSCAARPDSYPDFAGRFLHTAGEALLTAMCDNDADTVNLIFPDFFQSSLLQFNRIRAKAAESDWRMDFAVKVAVAPVLDLMDLSGYSILLSELHGNTSISSTIVNSWNDYLDSRSNTEVRSKTSFLASAIALTESGFEIAHRSLIRTGWKQKVSHRLQQLERRTAAGGRGSFISSQRIVVHESPLVRIYGRDESGLFHDGIDIFILRILRAREDGKDLQFSYRRRELGEELARNKRRSSDEDPEYA
jgi:hypothetical protein